MRDIEIVSSLKQGKAAARAATVIDNELLVDWLDQNFPDTHGPERNNEQKKYKPMNKMHPTLLGVVSVDYDNITRAWHTETIYRTLRLLGAEYDEKAFVSATGGQDWIDGSYGFKYFGVTPRLPETLDVPAVREQITAMSEHVTQDCIMQSFSGAVIKLAGVTCQVTDAQHTYGFPTTHPGTDKSPDAHIIRAWRTE